MSEILHRQTVASMKLRPTFCLDVDGVMTDGTFWYDQTGKVMKRFGPDDSDALDLLKPHIDIRFVSADHRGYAITHARISLDMGYKLDLISAHDRYSWLDKEFGLQSVIYMGDSFKDAPILRDCMIGIAPANASEVARRNANHVTYSEGGNRAVAEACFYVATLLGLSVPDFYLLED